MIRRRLGPLLFLCAVAVTSSCANDFSITQDGHAQQIAGARSSLTTRGAFRVVKVCGDYPTTFGLADSGGSVCLTIELSSASLASLGLPATLTVSGTAVNDATGAAVSVFTADPTTIAGRRERARCIHLAQS